MIPSNEAALLKAWPVLAPAGAHSGYASFDKDLSSVEGECPRTVRCMNWALAGGRGVGDGLQLG